MKTILVAAVLAAACGQNTRVDGKLEQLGEIRDAMCVCTDKPCTETQHDRFIAWKRDLKPDELSPKEQERFDSARDVLMACFHKLSPLPAAL